MDHAYGATPRAVAILGSWLAATVESAVEVYLCAQHG